MTTFIKLFDGLPIPSEKQDGGIFSATHLPKGVGRYLCKDVQSRPLILLSIKSSGSRKPANYSLEYLRIDHDLPCKIIDQEGKPQSGRFTLIHCLNADRDIQEYFLRVTEMLLDTLPEDAGLSDVSAAIDKLIALFRAMHQPSRKSIQGLWGELFLIINSKEPFTMLTAWHSEATDEMDFSDGHQRLELKCSSDGTRRHHFSLEQLCPPSGATQLIASMMLESSAGGKGLKELWDEARSIAAGDPDLLLKIERSCAGALGSEWQDSIDWKYDEERARESLLFFDPKMIPQVPSELPSGVSDVHFCSDLSHAEPLNEEALPELGSLFESATLHQD